MYSLDKKVAVVTGGGSGIGSAIAVLMRDNGAKVVIFDKHISETKQNDKNMLCIEGDLTNLEDIDNLYKQTFDVFGKIDIIAASAGVCDKLIIEDITEEFFDNIVNVNYKGTFFTVQKAVKYLNSSASIILVSSTAAHRSVSGNSVYSSTKAAISRMVKNFAADLADRKIRVNAVSPGTIETPMLGSNRSEEFISKIAAYIPFRDIGKPEDIANYVLFLASDKSKYITGTDLTIDGGLSGFIV
ncbi:MAG: SDR family oxidoreductase [bacterium]|nr:SDR family oxidoreductase [bacterium]